MPAHNILYDEIEGEVLVWNLRPVNGINTPFYFREFISVACSPIKNATFAAENILKKSQQFCGRTTADKKAEKPKAQYRITIVYFRIKSYQKDFAVSYHFRIFAAQIVSKKM